MLIFFVDPANTYTCTKKGNCKMAHTPELKRPQMQVLSVDGDYFGNPATSGSCYRVLVDDQYIRYICVGPDVYDQDLDVTKFLPVLLERLPPLPSPINWNVTHITKSPTGIISSRSRWEESREVTKLWHSKLVDILSLNVIKQRTDRVSEVVYGSGVAIAKIARFDWEIKYAENETLAYFLLQGHEIGPKFLGHLTEGPQGKVIGLLIEKLEGRSAGIGDIVACRKALKTLHTLGFIHGDVHRYNFIITEAGARLIDFEDMESNGTVVAMKKEVDSLEGQLTEETGRGQASSP